MRVYYDRDADMNLIIDKKIIIVGYGSQGHAHALNLNDSGVEVRVGLKSDSPTKKQVSKDGLQSQSVSEVSDWGDIIMLLAPDQLQASIYNDQIAPSLKNGKVLMFSHGFNIRYGTITPPADIDVSMVAPKSPGHRVRETYLSGEGTPALLAIHQDPSGLARDISLSSASALGFARA